MNTRGKWLARSGALLVLLGFVLPSLTVSCGGFREMGTTLSLAQLAERAEQPLLYLSPLCILVLLAASWLPAISRQAAQRNLIVQAAGWGVSLLGLLISFLALNSQLGQYGAIDISPEYGIGILLGGYGLSVIGLYLQWREEITAFGVTAGSWQVPESAYPAAPPPPVFEPPPPLAAGPRLELVQGTWQRRLFHWKEPTCCLGEAGSATSIYLMQRSLAGMPGCDLLRMPGLFRTKKAAAERTSMGSWSKPCA